MPYHFMRLFVLQLILTSISQIILVHPVSAAKPYHHTIAIVINNTQTLENLKLSPENLNPIFWRKQRYWPKGLPIKPVNLDIRHRLRAEFSQSVLGSLPTEQIDYWNGQYFNGIKPPYSVKSEEAVLRYVSKTKGAIGYVDACHVDDRIKPVLWINSGTITAVPPTNLYCP